MTECAHEWRLAKSLQFYWQEDDFGYVQGWFREKYKRIGYTTNYGRVDEYYCCRCTADRRNTRKETGDLPDWWSPIVETQYPNYTPGVFAGYEFLTDEETGK